MPERKYNPWFQFWAVLWISKDLETRKRARLLAFRKEDNDEISRGYWRSNWPRVLAGPLTGCHCRILREQIVWFCFYFYLFSSITVISSFFFLYQKPQCVFVHRFWQALIESLDLIGKRRIYSLVARERLKKIKEKKNR